MNIINIENVNYSYPNSKKKALQDITLSVTQGEFLLVLGETGAGKSTFCRLFNGIIPHSFGGCFSGTVTVDGTETTAVSVSRLALKTGMVFDDPDAQLFTSTVKDEAAFALENFLLPAAEIEEKVKDALKAVGLAGFEDRQPATLSGGEKQRLAIACALAAAGHSSQGNRQTGKILVLDEPLARLDSDGKIEVMSVIGEIRKKFKLTVIMAAAEIGSLAENIFNIADRICILKDGCITACDKTEKILANNTLLEENGIQPPNNKDFSQRFTEDTEDNKDILHCGSVNSVFSPCLCENSPFALNINNLTYLYKTTGKGIKNLSLSVKENDFIAIMGRNGCGKTTLLKNITGLLHRQSGDIFIRGQNTKELSVSDISRQIGFVMQNPDIQLFTDSVYKEAAFALENLKIPKKEIKIRVEKALSLAGLNDPDAFPHALNRADRVKTVIACVLAMNCRILIFDEVDAGLDYRESRQIMNLAKKLHERGFTIIFVTHNISIVCEYAKKIIMLDGKYKDGTK